VGYDPAKLTLQNVQLGLTTAGAYLQEVDLQTNNGYVGFAVLLNTGVSLPAGTQEVAQLVFRALPVTNNTVVNLTFGDTPTPRQVVDNNLNNLPATYQGGAVSITPAEYAGDVYPRTNGDHQVIVQDWLEIGRMVAGLDIVTNSDEMLRADCAPRFAPDKVISAADWVQAGRYALGLDPLTIVTPPKGSGKGSGARPIKGPLGDRILQIDSVSAQRGQTVSVPVQLVCTTNENAVGMTVGYNPNQLTLVGAALGSAITGGRIYVNTNQQAGEVGVALALSPGAALPTGTNQVAMLNFVVAKDASGPVKLTFDSSVAVLQVADRLANDLSATFIDGAVVLPPPPTLGVAADSAGLQLTWQVGAGTFEVQFSDSPLGPWTTFDDLSLTTNGPNVSVRVIPTGQQQFFRLQGQ
jgi:hypothetical protein